MATAYVPAAPALAKLLPTRNQIAASIETLMAVLDVLDGDEELEEAGLEDSFMTHPADGPGDPTADPDHCDAGDDSGTDYGTMGATFRTDGQPGDPEDAEDGGDTELNGDEGDYSR